MLEENKTLEDQLEEAERRRAEAERGRAEGRFEENKICLLGDSFCLNVPSLGESAPASSSSASSWVSFADVAATRRDFAVFLTAAVPQVLAQVPMFVLLYFFLFFFLFLYFCIFNCCCPVSARAGSDGLGSDDINININVGDDDDDDSEKQYLKSGSTEV